MDFKTMLALLMVAMLGQIEALSLADFQPQSSNLTPVCNAIYVTALPDCSGRDFAANMGGCSVKCINDLVKISGDIVHSCQGAAQNYNNLVGAFLNGTGLTGICSNVVVATYTATATSNWPVRPVPTLGPSATLSASTTSTTSITATTRSTTTMTLPSPSASTLVSSSAAASTTTSSTAAASSTHAVNTCEQNLHSQHGGTILDDNCQSAANRAFMSLGLMTAALLLALV